MPGSVVLQADCATISPGVRSVGKFVAPSLGGSVRCADFRPAFGNKQRFAHPREDILSQEPRVAPPEDLYHACLRWGAYGCVRGCGTAERMYTRRAMVVPPDIKKVRRSICDSIKLDFATRGLNVTSPSFSAK